MALNPNSKLIQQVVNQESADGTYQLVGLDIWEFADALDHPEETTSGRTNPTSISDPLGYEMAFVADMQSPNREIQEETDRIVKNLYTQIASADYSGKSVVCYIQHLDPRNESDRSMIRHRKNVSGWNASPDQLLRLKIAERVCGIFDPAMQMVVPSTNFRDTEINGMPTESYLESHPQIKRLVFAVDNDYLARDKNGQLRNWGQLTAAKWMKAYTEKGYACAVHVPHLNDFNTDLVEMRKGRSVEDLDRQRMAELETAFEQSAEEEPEQGMEV